MIYSDRDLSDGHDKKFHGSVKSLTLKGFSKINELYEDIVYYTELLQLGKGYWNISNQYLSFIFFLFILLNFLFHKKINKNIIKLLPVLFSNLFCLTNQYLRIPFNSIFISFLPVDQTFILYAIKKSLRSKKTIKNKSKIEIMRQQNIVIFWMAFYFISAIWLSS